MKRRVNKLCFAQNVAGWKTENDRQNISSTWKTISELRLQDESTTNNANVILDQIETFYKNLYASEGTFSDEECDTFIRNLELPKLSDEDRDSLEGQLTYDECKKVLETLQNDKAPGEDGFTVEFYKYFFELIGNDLLASFTKLI